MRSLATCAAFASGIYSCNHYEAPTWAGDQLHWVCINLTSSTVKPNYYGHISLCYHSSKGNVNEIHSQLLYNLQEYPLEAKDVMEHFNVTSLPLILRRKTENSRHSGVLRHRWKTKVVVFHYFLLNIRYPNLEIKYISFTLIATPNLVVK